jgi:NDP-sugar pyrophosphorylase family protein
MNILVLMAGKGQRFKDEGFYTPKPLIVVNGKSILQWTTESCPFIRHDGKSQNSDIKLHFAVLEEHLSRGLRGFLYKLYGKKIEIFPFKEVTRGSLETAYISCTGMLNHNDDLLVLDSDNKYNDNNMINTINSLPKNNNYMLATCFDNPDKSLPNKWSNVKVENGRVVGIEEKNDEWVEYPSLIGTFFFRNTGFFTNYARYILHNELPINNEYYMSMVYSNFLKVNGAYGRERFILHKVTDVVPLGTPTDVSKFGEIESA